jgi:branched-chain amino acid transport system substrate-binding protein
MKRTMRLLVIILAIAMLVSACSTTAPTTAAQTTVTTKAATGATTSATSSAGTSTPASGNVAKPIDPNKIYIGVVAARTGTNKATGEMAFNGATLAVEEVNAVGGILGKKIELIAADEIDNLQASVNATTRLLTDESITAIIGSQYSQNCLAILPQVLEKKMPYIACGSNNLIAKEKNPYVWQPRNLDNLGAGILAKYAYEKLGVKKPAILYSTLPNAMGPGKAVIEYYKTNYKIEIPASMEYGYSEEEKNFAPIISQIQNSGADGILSFGNQQPFVLISKAIADAGLTIPRLANATVTSNIVINNAGKAADGWYSTCDWAPYIDSPVGAKFQKNYFAKYNQNTETSNEVTYDSVYMIKKASEIANTTTDREEINNALAKVSNM